MKDAARQILGRIASAIGGFLVIKLITPYLGPLRFGDYTTVLKYFAIWSAFADFGLYVIAMKQLGEIKKSITGNLSSEEPKDSDAYKNLSTYYHKFVSSRLFMIGIVYISALVISYLIPSYTSNPYLIRGLPLGMIFSASFMTAGILQIPLQLFRQMKHLSIGLILARCVQLIILVLGIYYIFVGVDFNQSTPHILAFACVLLSVIASGITQGLYVFIIGKKHLPLRRNRDRSFTKELLGKNRQFGLAYYLSSFHTLIVVILISIFYPTTEGFIYAGVYGLALSLIEILLIVPSALGNSLMHDIGAIATSEKQKRFGSLMALVVLIGFLVIGNFVVFGPHVIQFLGGSDYLTTASQIGSDYILSFLGIVITLSFIKQVFNYLFVSTNHHNKLLWINLFGVIVGVGVGIPLLLHYNLIGGIITQILLELLFVLGAIFVARKQDVLPTFKHLPLRGLLAGTCRIIIFFLGSAYQLQFTLGGYRWIGGALLLNGVLCIPLFSIGKKIMRGL